MKPSAVEPPAAVPPRLARAGSSDRHLLSRSGLTFGSRVLAKLPPLAFVVVAAHLFPLAEFASYSYVIALATAIAIVADPGVSLVVARDIAAGRAAPSTAYWSGLPIVAAFGLIGAIALAGIALAFPGPGIASSTLALAAAFVMANRLLDYATTSLRAVGRFGLEAAMQLLVAVGFALPAVAIAVAGGGAAETVAVLTGVSAAGYAAAQLALLSDVGRPAHREALEWRRLVRPGVALSLGSSGFAVMTRLPLIALGASAPVQQVALYSASSRFADAAYLVATSAGQSLLPGLASLESTDPRRARRLLLRSLGWSAAAGLALSVALVPFADQMTTAVFGDRFADAAGSSRILLAGLALYALFGVGWFGMLALGRERAIMALGLLGAAVSLALCTALLPGAGVDGAAALYVASLGAVGAAFVVALLSPVSVPWRQMGLGLAAAALVCVAALSPTLALVSLLVAGCAALAWRTPALAVGLAIVTVGFEGAIKIRLAVEGVPAPTEVGAGLVDLSLLALLIGCLATDRREGWPRLRGTWDRCGRTARIGLSLLGLWLCWSIVQVASSPGSESVSGFRLIPAYALLMVVGAVLAAPSTRRGRAGAAISAAGLAIAGYAALRVATGPTGLERAYALSKDSSTVIGDVFRAVGPFSGTFGLVSVCVGLAAFALFLPAAWPRLRALGFATAGLAVIAIQGSYVRAGLVAVAIGCLLTVVLVALGGGMSRRARTSIVAACLAAIALGGVGTLIASTASPAVAARTEGILRPWDDESTKIRVGRWTHSLEAVRDHPLGTGLGSLDSRARVSDPATRDEITDNSYLRVLREQGVIGGGLLLLGLALLVGVAARAAMRGGSGLAGAAVAPFAGVASFGVLAFFSDYIAQPGKVIAWILLGWAIGAISAARSGAPPAGDEPPSLVDRSRLDALRRWRPRGRLAWSILAIALASATAAPALASALRQPTYSTRADLVETRAAARVPANRPPADRSADRVRALLEDPDTTTAVQRKVPFGALSYDELRSLPIERGSIGSRTRLWIEVSGDSPTRARELAATLQHVLPRLSFVRAGARPLPLVASGSPPTVERSERVVDRLVDALPGKAPPRADPLCAAMVGLAIWVALWLSLATLGTAHGRSESQASG